ncbi:fungal-specific transcription factor domain-containing protein [Aspergillus floccosus]
MPKRLPLSCENCRQRKVRCLGSGVPCDTCRKRGVAFSCRFKRDVVPSRQSDLGSPENLPNALLERISILETLLQQNIDLTSISINAHQHQALHSPLSLEDPVPPLEDLSQSTASTSTPGRNLDQDLSGSEAHGTGEIVTSPTGHIRYISSNSARQPGLLQLFQSPGQSESPSGFPFFAEVSSRESLLDMLPPSRQCDELIAVFLEVFSPLFHILHDPTFQLRYGEFKSNPYNAPLSLIGLIFIVLGLAITALDRRSSVLSDLGRESSPAANIKSLAAKYRSAAMKCLAADNFLWRHDMSTLQCLILLIYAINHAQGPAWSLLGTTLNIATTMGCHVDPAFLNVNPIEAEERRRAWAALMMLHTIQNTSLGLNNLTPFEIVNRVRLPADLEDDDVMLSSSQLIDHTVINPPPEQRKPTKMSYILFKFRLYQLASDICSLTSTDGAAPLHKTRALDDRIKMELDAQAERFSGHSDLPTYHRAHSFILTNFTYHLILLLHRHRLTTHGQVEHEEIRAIYERCEHAALSMISNYETLHTRPEFQAYSWYTHGLGSFHAFFAMSTLLALLDKTSAQQDSKHSALQAMQACLEKLREAAPYSEICNRVCSILGPLLAGEMYDVYPLGTSGCMGSSKEPLTMDTSGKNNAFDLNDWSLPESFEHILSGIPSEQWLSPAVFPWADAVQIPQF